MSTIPTVGPAFRKQLSDSPGRTVGREFNSATSGTRVRASVTATPFGLHNSLPALFPQDSAFWGYPQIVAAVGVKATSGPAPRGVWSSMFGKMLEHADPAGSVVTCGVVVGVVDGSVDGSVGGGATGSDVGDGLLPVEPNSIDGPAFAVRRPLIVPLATIRHL